MSGFTHRELSKHERHVVSYEQLVESLVLGYNASVYEYANDISCRQALEAARAIPEVRQIWGRVEKADSRLRKILAPTKGCIQGSYPRECFWYWGYPPNSPELESDLRRLDLL
jgi:hypothetical protein